MRSIYLIALAVPLASSLDPSLQSGCPAPPEPFSLVVLPDTQYYTEQPDNSLNPYYLQTQWIVDHQADLNIAMALHMGDITDNSYPEQWTIADKAHRILDEAGVRYTMLPGNHDYPREDGVLDRDASNFNTYFGVSRFEGRPEYGGHYGSGNENNYFFFEQGSLEFMIVNLEFAPRKDVLCWANDLIRSNPQKRVIIATHCYLTVDGNHSTSCATENDVVGGNGEVVWDELASRHSNVFLVLSGHVNESEYTLRTGINGNPVHEILTDYQKEEPCSAEPCDDHCDGSDRMGNGWLRTLEFRPSENRVLVSIASVEDGNPDYFVDGVPALYCDQYTGEPTDLDHTFAFDYDMTSSLPPYSFGGGEGIDYHDRTVNATASGQQTKSVVAQDALGMHVVAYEDNRDSGDFQSIRARGFARGGCEELPDFAVSTGTAGLAKSPSIAMDFLGNFVVVWADDRDNNGVYQIHARGFASDGTVLFEEMTVNSVSDGQQYHPQVAMSDGGDFVVVWEDDPEKDGIYQLLARGFYADGTEMFHDLLVNERLEGQHQRPAIAMTPGGDFAVAWEDDYDSNGSYQVRVRGLTSTGSVWLPELTVNSVSEGQQLDPSIALSPTLDMVVVWEDDKNKNDSYEILARGLDPFGAERFHDLTINTDSSGSQQNPAVSMDPAGNFVVVWEDDSSVSGDYDVHARGFLPSGQELLAEAMIHADSDGSQIHPSVSFMTGGYVVTWQDDVDQNDTYQILSRGISVAQ